MRIKNNIKRNLTLFIIFIMLLIALVPTGQSTIVNADVSSRILCRFEEGKVLANLQSTDYFYYLTRSKSALTSIDKVNSKWLNKLLVIAGYDFNTPNEAILGREIRPTEVPEARDDDPNESAPKVSAFDRFGMAGLKWSSYQGEWKYNQVDVCANQGQISPTTYGNFYEKRLEPQSTYNEVSTSKDPRSIQFNKGLISNAWGAIINTLANGIFSIAKGIVTLTIVFVGLAFTDITTLFGLSADGTGGITVTGVFSDLFNTIFYSFVVMAIILTAIYVLYKGLIKRELRFALNTVIQTIAIFIVATIMATNPSYWVGFPNKVASYGQAIVLNAMAGIYDNLDEDDNPSLCTTEVSSVYDNVDLDNLDESRLMSEFEKMNMNTRSIIGCKLWEGMLFKPWVRGQFGTDYENLDARNLGNINEAWVGLGSVPVGNGQTIDNWALFHLSTQTDAHSQIGDNNFPTLVNDVNADWWRIVDALSNYDEAESTEVIGNEEHTHMIQVDSDPTEYWQTWVGNNSGERIGTALIAIVFGIVGSIAPLFFALASAVFGFGITLLMMIAPLFFLFGVWGGKGQQIFLGWLSTLANTVLKRIATSILLVLSIAITLSIMNLVYTIGFVKAFILMIIVTVLLVKNKNKMLNLFASIDFGGTFNPMNKASQMYDSTKRKAKQVGKIGLAAAAGARAGRQTGQGFFHGAGVGARSQLKNALYQSPLGVNIVRQYDITVEGEEQESHSCIMCRVSLGDSNKKEVAFRDDEGNYYCVPCAEELGLETLYEVTVRAEKGESGDFALNKATRNKPATNQKSLLRYEDAVNLMQARVVEDRYYWNNDGVQKMIEDNINNLGRDIVVFGNISKKIGRQASPPPAPQMLHEYIDIALLNEAWTNGQAHVVENTYKEAWKMWYEDNAKLVQGLDQKDIDEFKEKIENIKINVTAEQAEEEMNEFYVHHGLGNIGALDDEESNRSLYIYYEGKLMFNKYTKK